MDYTETSSQLVDKDSLREVFGPEVWDSKNGEEVNVQCPYCVNRMGRPDRSGHLGLNFGKNAAHCVRCGWGTRRLRRWLREQSYTGVIAPKRLGQDGPTEDSIFDALRNELTQSNNSVNKSPIAMRVQETNLPDGCVPLLKCYDDDYIDSLLAKGLTRKQLSRWELYACEDGDHRGYVIFPFRELGDLVYWQGRAIYKSLPRKYSPPLEMGSSNWVYNYPDHREENLGKIIGITEGTLDCITATEVMRKYPEYLFISIQGTNLSTPGRDTHLLNSQIGKIKSLEPSRVLLLLDPAERTKPKALKSTLGEYGMTASIVTYPTRFGDPNYCGVNHKKILKDSIIAATKALVT